MAVSDLQQFVMDPGSFQRSWGLCCTLLPTGSLSKYPRTTTQYP